MQIPVEDIELGINLCTQQCGMHSLTGRGPLFPESAMYFKLPRPRCFGCLANHVKRSGEIQVPDYAMVRLGINNGPTRLRYHVESVPTQRRKAIPWACVKVARKNLSCNQISCHFCAAER